MPKGSRGEGGPRPQEQKIAEKKVETKTVTKLPELVLPKFLESYAGREFKEGLLLMAAELEEYEPLITEQKMPINEVVEYLGFINFFDTYPAFITHLAKIFVQHTRAKIKQMTERESYTLKAAQERMTRLANSVLDSIRKDQRPLLRALYNECIAETLNIEDEDRWMGRLPDNDSESIAVRQAEWSFDTGLTTREDGMKKAMAFWGLKGLLSQLGKEAPKLIQYKGEDDKLEGDLLTEEVRKTLVEPGEYTLPADPRIPWITSIIVEKKEDAEPLLWARVYISQDIRPEARKENIKWDMASLNISYFNGDLGHPFNLVLPLLREDLKQIANEDSYEVFRRIILEKIVAALHNQTIKNKLATEQKELPMSAEHGRLTESTPVTHITIDTTITSAPDLLTNKTEAESKPRQPDIIKPEKPEAEKKEKIGRMTRNITREKALNILTGQFGVTETQGAKHTKLSREVEGKRIIIPLPNLHSPGAMRNFPYILRRILKFLKIDLADFYKCIQ